jgi:putative DNA primase/helicase
VYESEGKFREHRIEDYISLTVGYSYDPSATSEDLDMFLCDIMPDHKQREYLLWTCSQILDGKIPNDFLVFITGSGGNGKSMFMNLLDITLGELCTSVPSTLFTRKDSDSDRPRPDLIRLRSRRFGYITEPDTGILNTAIVKKLCGSDSISCRNIYGQQMAFQFRTKFAIVCNDLPEIPGGNDSIWRRIRTIKFTTRFVTNPSKSDEKMLNPLLSTMIQRDITWRQVLMNKLISLMGISVDIPIDFISLRQEYMDMSNEFTRFLEDQIKRSPGSILKLHDILMGFFHTESDIPRQSTKEYKRLFNLTRKYIENTFCGNREVTYKRSLRDRSIVTSGWTNLTLQ